MTQEEIDMGNPILCEFMGIQHVGHNIYVLDDTIYGEMFHVSIIGGLQFHDSWDWLMPVCAKIDTLDYSGLCPSDLQMYCNECNVMDHLVSCYEIEPVYRKVVSFIRWWNSIQTKKYTFKKPKAFNYHE